MIGSLKIERFRGISSGCLDEFTPLTVIVGPNGSGTSTVLEAFHIAAPVPITLER
jgi:AAA15 family ATPase/GTPase